MSSSFGSAGAAGLLRSVLGVPFRLQTYRNLCYVVLAFPLGILYFVLFSFGISIGLTLTIVVVGIPILLAILALASGLATVERELAALLLGVEIPTRDGPGASSFTERIRLLVTDLGTWTALVYLVTKLAIGVVAYLLVTTLLVTSVSMLAVPFVYRQPGVYVGVVTDAPIRFDPAIYVGWDDLLVGLDGVVTLSTWRIDTLAEALAVAAAGAVLGLLALHLLNVLAWLSGRYTRFMLRDRSGDADASGAGS